jgi:hypothetical protein
VLLWGLLDNLEKDTSSAAVLNLRVIIGLNEVAEMRRRYTWKLVEKGKIKAHDMDMASKPSQPKSNGTKRTNVLKIGRSSLTGQFVLKPVAIKGGTITQRQANTAVKLASIEHP